MNYLDSNNEEAWDINCEIKSLKQLFENGKLIDYGNNVTDTISQIFLLFGKELRNELDLYKQRMKNKRKPTDIIVIADGFSFSATSTFLKYLQYYGGGITVGILGILIKQIFHLIVVYHLQLFLVMKL